MPRLTAVWTCSRPLSSRMVARVTRATMPIDDTANAMAGSVKCWMLVTGWCRCRAPGNQPSLTENTRISAIDATNAGMRR